MEASGTTPPSEPAAAAPPPPHSGSGHDEKAGGGWRVLAIVLALALAFAAAVMILVATDLADTPTCEDVRAGLEPPNDEGECYDGSSGEKTAQMVLSWPSGILAAIAALVALYFAATGLRGRLLLQLTGAAVLLGGLSILLGAL